MELRNSDVAEPDSVKEVAALADRMFLLAGELHNAMVDLRRARAVASASRQELSEALAWHAARR
jgi:hypothetical protein